MQAVILAGGLGTRLGEITRHIPKPMVSVAGVPYLEHQLRLLREQGFTDVVLLTGYLGEQIQEYFGDGGGLGLSLHYSRELTPQGTGGALREASELLASDFLLLYGDSYLPIDYRAVMESLRASDALGVVVAYDNRLGDTSVKNNLGISPGGVVSRYHKTNADLPGLHFVEAGVLAFRREVVDLIPAQGQVSLEEEVFTRLIPEGKLRAVITEQRFYDIGTPERLKAIEALFS